MFLSLDSYNNFIILHQNSGFLVYNELYSSIEYYFAVLKLMLTVFGLVIQHYPWARLILSFILFKLILHAAIRQ